MTLNGQHRPLASVQPQPTETAKFAVVLPGEHPGDIFVNFKREPALSANISETSIDPIITVGREVKFNDEQIGHPLS